jgi:hypothetical protein
MTPPTRRARAPVKTLLEVGESSIGSPYEKDEDNAKPSPEQSNKKRRAKDLQPNETAGVTESEEKEAGKALALQVKMLKEDDRFLIENLVSRLLAHSSPLKPKSVRRCGKCRSTEHVQTCRSDG